MCSLASTGPEACAGDPKKDRLVMLVDRDLGAEVAMVFIAGREQLMFLSQAEA